MYSALHAMHAWFPRLPVLITANGMPTDASTHEAFWDAAGRLAWHLYCA